MAQRGDKRKDIELWIAGTNQETVLPVLLDKGPFSPAASQTFPSPPPHFMTRQSEGVMRSPTLWSRRGSTLLKPPKPSLPNTTRSSLSITKARSTPPSPSYITLTTTAHLSHSEDNLLKIGSPTQSPVNRYTENKNFSDNSTSTGNHGTSIGDHSTSTGDHGTSTGDHNFSIGDRSTSTGDHSASTGDRSASTGSDHSTCTGDHTVITEQVLTLLSEYIGSKLLSLTIQLGLSRSDYDNAVSSYRLPDTQALCILRLWYSMKDRSLHELTSALESAGLPEVALKLQNGHLKSRYEKSDKSAVPNQSSKGDTSSRRYKPLAQCRGFSIQGEDGMRTVVIKRTAGFGEDKDN